MNPVNPKINQNIKRFFWDIDFSKLDFVKSQDFIIERILELGDQESTDWLFSFYNKEVIANVLKRSTRLSPKSANFWALILGVPREEILCLNRQSLNKPGTIWKY